MKPVFQSTIDPERCDCFSAALASLLEVPLETIPRFAELHGKYGVTGAARSWLALHYGLSLVTIQMEQTLETGTDIRIVGAVPGTPCIAGGRSTTFEGEQHAVVGEIDEHGMNFRMTHDPNPSGRGIVGRPLFLYFLVPLDYTLTLTGHALDLLRREVEELLDQTFRTVPLDSDTFNRLSGLYYKLKSHKLRSGEREQTELVYKDILKRQFEWVKEMNWLHTNPLEDLALLTSEIGEAVNEVRGEVPTENFKKELADVLLRVGVIALKHNIDLLVEADKKVTANIKRGSKGRLC